MASQQIFAGKTANDYLQISMAVNMKLKYFSLRKAVEKIN